MKEDELDSGRQEKGGNNSGAPRAIRRRGGRFPIVVSLIGVIVIAAVAIGVSMALGVQRVKQPLAFNHYVHVEEAGMDCTDCHLHVLETARATIPNLGVCVDCHEEPFTDSPVEVQLAEYIENETPIPWQKVYWLPDHVFFSHRRHTAVGSVGCETCHGLMAERTVPVEKVAVRHTMEHCMECHKEVGVANDCLLCHR